MWSFRKKKILHFASPKRDTTNKHLLQAGIIWHTHWTSAYWHGSNPNQLCEKSHLWAARAAPCGSQPSKLYHTRQGIEQEANCCFHQHGHLVVTQRVQSVTSFRRFLSSHWPDRGAGSWEKGAVSSPWQHQPWWSHTISFRNFSWWKPTSSSCSLIRMATWLQKHHCQPSAEDKNVPYRSYFSQAGHLSVML